MSDINGQAVVNGVVQTGGVGGAVPAQGVSVVQNPQGTVPVQQYQNTQAMFTQEQLNSIVQGRVNPLNSKISELNNQLAQLTSHSESLLAELTRYKNREAVSQAGVAPNFADFVSFEAQKLAVNGKSFEDALKEYVQANPHFTTTGQMGSQPSQPTTPAGGQATQVVANPAQGAQQPATGVGGVGANGTNPTGVVNNTVVQMGGTSPAQSSVVTGGTPQADDLQTYLAKKRKKAF